MKDNAFTEHLEMSVFTDYAISVFMKNLVFS
jgi:hypothetical protein